MDELLAAVSVSSKGLTLFDEEFVGVIFNGVAMLSEDFNDNTNIDGSDVVELLITQLDDAGVSDCVKETRASPLKKTILRRWKGSEVSEAEVGETQHCVMEVGSVAEEDTGETPDVNLCCDKTNWLLLKENYLVRS